MEPADGEFMGANRDWRQASPDESWLKAGWGGRDRTYECRNQNPVPYHLATPQLLFCKIMQGMAIKSLRHKTLHTVWNLPQRRPGP